MNLKDWKDLIGWLGILVVCGFMFGAFVDISPYGRDDSDQVGWGSTRSGLKLHVDALTGCQYLSASSGGVIVRVNGAGQHLGCKE